MAIIDPESDSDLLELPDPPVPVAIELDEAEAWALGEVIGRLTIDDVRRRSQSEEQVRLAMQALAGLDGALRRATGRM
jgi:hypothetical protein